MVDKKLNGTQQARKDEAEFKHWADAFETEIDLNPEKVAARVKALLNKASGCLLRKRLAIEVGFKDSQPFSKNIVIKGRLTNLEDKLRPKFLPAKKDVLPQKKQPKCNNQDTPVGTISDKEAAKLTQRILELESENRALKGDYGRFSEVAEVYRRLGDMK
ncbi:hypothetical protein [Colwellia psychrerythraea]|uniref:Uncharacterized protein n=1 Tax=Colwellia psychrerythraea (strain 34H / ATCC BAA-681) TaxID=167879 RepID=Q48AF8_COLP3|nr:hypothetical protein [Colwellia psychrerythraea]AAZ28842.1 hypothetical protein CPS_0187 [Colwellia psychrerythraea 34H]